MADSKTGAGNTQDEPEGSDGARCKEMVQKTHNDGECQRGTRAKAGTIWATKYNSIRL